MLWSISQSYISWHCKNSKKTICHLAIIWSYIYIYTWPILIFYYSWARPHLCVIQFKYIYICIAVYLLWNLKYFIYFHLFKNGLMRLLRLFTWPQGFGRIAAIRTHNINYIYIKSIWKNKNKTCWARKILCIVKNNIT